MSRSGEVATCHTRKSDLTFQTGSKISLTHALSLIQSDTKKRELLKNPTKIEEIQEKKMY